MRVREVELKDLPSISRLMEAAGLMAFTPLRWERDWALNPAIRPDDPAVSRGWVLEDGKEIAGFSGNSLQMFSWQGRTLRAATGWGYLVAPEARGSAMLLPMAFARQRQVDLLLVTNATPPVPEIFETLKFVRLPQPDFNIGLYWVTGPLGLLRAALRRAGVPLPLASAASAIIAPALWAESRFRNRRLGAVEHGLTVESLDPARVGPEFDLLWRRKCKESSRLFFVRTAEVLRWHFSSMGRVRPPVLFTAHEKGDLVGYLALIRDDKQGTGLTRVRVADMIALRDDPNVIGALLRRAYEYALADRVHMLEIMGYPEHIRRTIHSWSPREWRLPSWPYLYKATDPAVHEALRSAECWYATGIDGEGSLEPI